MNDATDPQQELVQAPADPMGAVITLLQASDGVSSPDKVRGVAELLLTNAAQSEQGAQLVSILEVVKTLGVDPAAYLPQDPGELDFLLLRAAELMLAARSDDAQPFAVANQ